MKILLIITVLLIISNCKDSEVENNTAVNNNPNTNNIVNGNNLNTCDLSSHDYSSPFGWANGSWRQAKPQGALLDKEYVFDFTSEPSTKTAYYHLAIENKNYCYIKIENTIVEKNETIDLESNFVKADLMLTSANPVVLEYSGNKENLKRCEFEASRFIPEPEINGEQKSHPQALILKCASLAIDQDGIIYTKQSLSNF